MEYNFSPQEQELSDKVRKICKRKDTYMGVMLASCIYGFVDETLAYINDHPDIDSEELIRFVSERTPEDDNDEDEFDENYLEQDIY